ncbi:hypothetical protein Ciccas_008464 [Cichlidogyrus casuarinus]|uniref:Uncharacterized protein n=1 Tax=Cichlidogyrus casuarinus TaxID=1844966 RepID=A0ABD2Q0D8_9PLAT
MYSLGRCETRFLTRDEIRELKTWSLSSIKLMNDTIFEPNGRPVDFTMDVVMHLKNLICGIDQQEIRTLQPDAIYMIGYKLVTECTLANQEMSDLVATVKKLFPKHNQMGEMLLDYSSGWLKKLRTEKVIVLLAGLWAAEATMNVVSRTKPSCTHISALAGHMPDLILKHNMVNIEPREMLICVAKFCQGNHWNMEQAVKAAKMVFLRADVVSNLLKTLKSHEHQHSMITKLVSVMGCVTYGLENDEFDWISPSVAEFENMGDCPNIPVKRRLEVFNLTLNGTEIFKSQRGLINLGSLLCIISEKFMSLIDGSEFRKALPWISEAIKNDFKICPMERLEQLWNITKKTAPSAKSWTPSLIIEIGPIFGIFSFSSTQDYMV